MSIEHVKKTAFPPIGLEKWQAAVERSLTGKEIHSLLKQTYEGIDLSPLYTKKDITSDVIDQLPGEGSYRRGFEKSHLASEWKIAQRLSADNWNELKSQLESALENGQDTVSLDIDKMSEIESIDFKVLTESVNLNDIPIVIMTKSNHPIIAEKLNATNQNISGIFGSDLISSRLSEGLIFEPEDTNWINWEKNIKNLNKFPHLKTILINTTPYHQSGANAVQELAIAIAETVFYIEFLKEKGWDHNQIAAKMAIHFSIGSQFFMEVAKLRSIRVLWQTIAIAYGIENTTVSVSAETSEFTKTALDPYVNILRASNEAFAAIIGGIDYLHITPFDAIMSSPTSLSERIARNPQLILKEEAYLNKVTDPSGGTHYVEALTNELVSQAWKLFQEIDKLGGIIKTLETGWIQEKINQSLQQKLDDVQSGKASIIGVNVYRQQDGKQTLPKQLKEKIISGGKKIERLPKTRLAETIEKAIFNQRMGEMKHGE